MKILLINNVFKSGSTGNIVKNLFEKLSKTNDLFVIYGRGKKINNGRVVKKTFELESKFCHFCSLFSGNMYGGMYFSTKRIIKYIKKVNPDVVNLHCLNGYFVNIYTLLIWLAENNYKTVLTMHADFMMTGGCGYTVECNKHKCCECRGCEAFKQFNGRFSLNTAHKQYLKLKKAISKFDNEHLKVTCVSPWLTERYKKSPIYQGLNIETIINPVDDVFMEHSENNPYKSKNNFLYVTPDIYDQVKSGWLIRDIAKNRQDLNFTIVCTKDIDFKFDEPNINYIKGGLSKEKLRDYYYYADGTLLLSKRETFSMVVAESLLCGTPVYGFKSGGPESICINEYCKFVDFGNLKSISASLKPNNRTKNEITNLAKKKYNSNTIANLYLKSYNF